MPDREEVVRKEQGGNSGERVAQLDSAARGAAASESVAPSFLPRGSKWSFGEDVKLRNMMRDGAKFDDIGEELRRSTVDVRRRARLLGLIRKVPLPTPEESRRVNRELPLPDGTCPNANMILSPWETMPDGVQVRTLTGI